MALKNLPLGIQDFELLITGNHVYVDKTKLIYDLIKNPVGYYFLSRPRRFGKSLLVSTLDCIFEEKKELFKDLWLYENTDWQWEKHPVITIDFNKIDHSSPESLKKDILKTIHIIASKHDIKLSHKTILFCFMTLIIELKNKYNKNVVVLVDEYDKPIVNHLDKGKEELQIAMKNRDVLRKLFGPMKSPDVSSSLRFVLITGITNLMYLSIFGALYYKLNNLTLLGHYSTLLGYTQDELEDYFKKHIMELAEAMQCDTKKCKALLREWYNGYQFTKNPVKVYNPFSILSALFNKELRNYWFEISTPAFPVHIIKEKNYYVPDIEKLQLNELSFSTFYIESITIEALLFQTGYITITGYADYKYKLSYPNREVKKSFLNYLFNDFVEIPDSDIKSSFLLLHTYLKESNFKDFINTVNTILASIPYSQIAGKDEAYYHTVFYLILSASGVEVLTEVLTSRGRIDIAVFFDDKTFIIELKCNQDADLALQQIEEKGYAEKYRDKGKQIILMGINFDTVKRVITEWKVERT